MSHLGTTSLSRRTVLGAGAAAGLAALTACAPDNSASEGNTGDGSPATSSDPRPAHIPFAKAPTPEFPPGDGVPAGYTALPSELVDLGSTPLPSTPEISLLLQGSAPAVGYDTNEFYRLVTSRVGTTFDLSYGGYADYLDKFQVTIAGNDIPDLVMMTNVARMPDLLEARFTELSEFLAGDKIADYPGLASIAPATWKVPVLNGGLWGVSKPRPAAEGRVLLGRAELLQARGVDPSTPLSSGEDLMALLTEMSDARAKVYAMAQEPTAWLMPVLVEMFGAPNGWRETNGSFVHQYESEEMKAAIEQAAKIWAAGVLHPESFVHPEALGWWEAGTISLLVDGVAGWTGYARTHADWDVHGFVAPKWNGGGAAIKHLTDAGYPSYVAIRQQSSPDRVRELLRVIDAIAAPFGTKQWLEMNYGIEGEHYTVDDGIPVVTPQMAKEKFRIDYLGAQSDAQLFSHHDLVQRQHEYLSTVMPTGEPDASDGLYSETALSKGAAESRKITSLVADLIQGRRPMGEWDTAVASWRSTVGDAMRSEYEEAFAANR